MTSTDAPFTRMPWSGLWAAGWIIVLVVGVATWSAAGPRVGCSHAISGRSYPALMGLVLMASAVYASWRPWRIEPRPADGRFVWAGTVLAMAVLVSGLVPAHAMVFAAAIFHPLLMLGFGAALLYGLLRWRRVLVAALPLGALGLATWAGTLAFFMLAFRGEDHYFCLT